MEVELDYSELSYDWKVKLNRLKQSWRRIMNFCLPYVIWHKMIHFLRPFGKANTFWHLPIETDVFWVPRHDSKHGRLQNNVAHLGVFWYYIHICLYIITFQRNFTTFVLYTAIHFDHNVYYRNVQHCAVVVLCTLIETKHNELPSVNIYSQF